MAITLDGTTGITTPGLTNTGSTTIVALTTTGNTTLGDASTDTLNVGNGGLVKDASGNVGVGVTSPQNRLQVVTTTRPQFSVSYNGTTGLYLEDSTASVGKSWKIATSTAVASALEFYQSTATSGVPTWAATAAMTLNTNGVLALQGASTSANGVGITFPATQSASSDANTLDDYEEGTWTPAVTFGGGATGVTYGTGNAGFYTKIGRMVQWSCYLTVTNKGSSSGAIILTSLPFPSYTGTNSDASRTGSVIGYIGGGGANTNTMVTLNDPVTSSISFRIPNGSDIQNTDFSTAFQIYIGGTYFTT